MATGFPCDHNASPKLFVDPAGDFLALLVESLAGAELRQLDYGRHEVRANLVAAGQRGQSLLFRWRQHRGLGGRWVARRRTSSLGNLSMAGQASLLRAAASRRATQGSTPI